MKRCFSTLGCADRSLRDILCLAKRYGIDAIEVRGIEGELNNGAIKEFLPENASQTAEMMKASGVRPLILGTSCSFHHEKSLENNIKEGKEALMIAERIGFGAIRVFGNNIVGDESECLNRIAEGIKELCICGEKTGVNVYLEVHGDINTLERIGYIAEICSSFTSFGIIWDICHTHNVYGDHWRSFYDPLAPLIRHVHIKDISSGRLVLPGKGEIHIAEIVKHLTENGYNGYFSLEWERHWHRELCEIEGALDEMFRIFESRE